MAVASNRFVNVSEEGIEKMSENAIPEKTKRATKYGLNFFKVNV